MRQIMFTNFSFEVLLSYTFRVSGYDYNYIFYMLSKCWLSKRGVLTTTTTLSCAFLVRAHSCSQHIPHITWKSSIQQSSSWWKTTREENLIYTHRHIVCLCCAPHALLRIDKLERETRSRHGVVAPISLSQAQEEVPVQTPTLLRLGRRRCDGRKIDTVFRQSVWMEWHAAPKHRKHSWFRANEGREAAGILLQKKG